MLENILSGLIGGLIVWGIQQYYVDRKAKLKETEIKNNQSHKILNKDFLYLVKPGINLEMIKSEFGIPFKVMEKDAPIFGEEVIKTNSFLYMFKNANVKITSKDNKTVDSMTIFPLDKSFDFRTYAEHLNLNSYRFNEAKVNKELLLESEHTFLTSRHDYTFAFSFSIGNPFYLQITLFGYCKKGWHEYFENENPDFFIGDEITGICISSYMEKNIYYIYQYELG